jgi:hypothetical protein
MVTIYGNETFRETEYGIIIVSGDRENECERKKSESSILPFAH